MRRQCCPAIENSTAIQQALKLNMSTGLHLFTMRAAADTLLEIRKLQLTVKKTWFINVLILMSNML